MIFRTKCKYISCKYAIRYFLIHLGCYLINKLHIKVKYHYHDIEYRHRMDRLVRHIGIIVFGHFDFYIKEIIPYDSNKFYKFLGFHKEDLLTLIKGTSPYDISFCIDLKNQPKRVQLMALRGNGV